MIFLLIFDSTTMMLQSSGPISKAISANLGKSYDSLRYTAPRPIPSSDDLDLTKEEDYFHPEEPKSQAFLIEKVYSRH